MKQQLANADRMGTEPIRKLLISMSAPLCISMLFSALYNVVDSIFVSRIGEQALAATSLAFPVQTLMTAFSLGMSVGMTTLISRSLGEGSKKQAQEACYNGIFIALCGTALFTLFGLFGARAFFAAQTSNPTIIEYGTTYTSIICSFSIFAIFGVTFERVLQATGNTIYNMISQSVGAIFNCIFDPILIFGLCGFPAMGIKGAAIATIAGQLIGMIIALVLNVKKNQDVSVIWKKFRPRWEIIKEILSVGIPSFFMQAITSVTTYLMNLILISLSEAAVTLFGIYFRLQTFIALPMFGISNAMVPIIAYNYGAKDKIRITDTVKHAVLITTVIMACGTAIFCSSPTWLLKLFNAQGELLELGRIALVILSLSFIFAGINTIIQSTYQALGNGMEALIISILRQVVFILPTAYMFGKVFGKYYIWWAFPLAELISIIVNLFMFKKINKEKINILDKVKCD